VALVGEAQAAAGQGAATASIDRTRLTVVAGPLARPVVARVIGILAARAQLPLDRVQDAVLLADAICHHAPDHLLGDRITLSIATADAQLELRVGPLRPGGPARMVSQAALPGTGDVVQRLASATEVRRASAGEYLWLLVGTEPAGHGSGA
jgi:serine/threonine-protein kinase RsbW